MELKELQNDPMIDEMTRQRAFDNTKRIEVLERIVEQVSDNPRVAEIIEKGKNEMNTQPVVDQTARDMANEVSIKAEEALHKAKEVTHRDKVVLRDTVSNTRRIEVLERTVDEMCYDDVIDELRAKVDVLEMILQPILREAAKVATQLISEKERAEEVPISNKEGSKFASNTDYEKTEEEWQNDIDEIEKEKEQFGGSGFGMVSLEGSIVDEHGFVKACKKATDAIESQNKVAAEKVGHSPIVGCEDEETGTCC